jgi:hypothetical protein
MEERGHDGLTSEERIAQMTQPIAEDWYSHQIAIVNKRNAKLEADNKALLDAAKGVKKLLEEPSPFYLKKLGGSITDGDQKQIDDVFIALDAAIEHSEPQ